MIAKESPVNPTRVEIHSLIKRQNAAFDPTNLRPLPAKPGVIHPANPALKDHYAFLEVTQLSELKLLMGIPNHTIDHKAALHTLPSFDPDDLPRRDDFQLDALDARSQKAVSAAIRHLLFGWVDADALESGPLAAVARNLLQANRIVPVLTAADLTVQNNQQVTFDTPTADFNTITIYGNGQIILEADCKFTAQTVQHLSA